jgi:AcrR family transcriptional regulator
LLEEEGLEGVSLNAIARRVGLAKSNVYRYFDSRAEILLWLVLSDWADWTDEVERELVALVNQNDADAVAKVLAAAFAGRPRLCELTAVLAAVAEPKVSGDVLLNLETRVDSLRVRAANALHAALPKIAVVRWAWALRAIHGVVAGLWPMSRLVPAASGALARPELKEFRPDFYEDLERAVRALLYGLLVEASRESRR